MPKQKNDPWNVESLYEFQYFNCPSCEFKHGEKQDFLHHAYKSHPDSINSLSNITDGSLDNVLCPWDSHENVESIKNEVESEQEQSDEQEYSVEKIIDKRCNLKGQISYLIKWKGYEDIDNTWEPIDNLYCLDLIKEFERSHKTDLEFSEKGMEDFKTEDIIIPETNKESNQNVVVQMVKCYYCAQEMERSIVRIHMEKSHPSKPVIFNIVKDKKCITKEEDEKDIFESSTKEEEINSSQDLTMKQEFDNNETINIVKCYHCSVAIIHSEIRLHIEDQHPGEEVIYIPIESVKTDDAADDNIVHEDHQSDFNCDLCNKSFPKADALKRHMKCHSAKVFKCSTCQKSFSRSYHLKTHVAVCKSYKCDFCEEVFLSQALLITHMKDIHQEKPKYNCEVCGRTFSKKYYIKSHIQHVHAEKIHTCDLCGKSFTLPKLLEKHVEWNHEESEKELVCNICGKTFNNSAKYNAHVDYHKDCNTRRTNVCEKCGNSFTGANKLKLHIQSVHEKRRDHKCKICGKFFSQDSSMKKHIKEVHEGIKKTYNCDQCEKTFFEKRYLRDHISFVHEGNKKHQCNTCGKTYPYYLALKAHITAVHGDQSFNCAHCGKMFAAKEYMKAHVKHVHEGKPWSRKNRENKTPNI